MIIKIEVNLSLSNNIFIYCIHTQTHAFILSLFFGHTMVYHSIFKDL